ncbi:major capsid protein [Rhizobium sp. NLR22b]|uniref:major capsid protein n=1 Tax=Rhizobium sp. NLR22b TaxID=2731115 RepID=UPI001C83F176|nr:major capsid protein [Rhizobium sp. NLR22b]MBX5238630.1 hypothetical protein [Rhizobium sp. NLR22b]
MATGKASDFKVYQEYLQTRMTEILTQNGDLFNVASNGAIVMTSASKRGDYEYEAFFKSISGLASRRDTTSTSSATDLALTQDEFVRVKLNRKIGPVANTRDSFRKIMARYSQTEFTDIVAEQASKAQQLDMLNSTLRAGRAALVNQSAVLYTIPSNGTMTTAGLVNGLAKRGDRADDVVCWVMHSKVYFDLVLQQISANIDGLSNFNVQTGTPVTLNRPVVISDSAALAVTSGSPAVMTYYTLGLTANALLAESSEEDDVVVDEVTGNENLIVRIQGEYAFNAGVKGFKWDVANGGANPNDTALATGSNWDPAVTDYKDYAGIVIASR